MFTCSINTLEQFKEVLSQLSQDTYVLPCTSLSNATIGQHTRHIIELYQCMIKGYEQGVICYDKRERNKNIEEQLSYAIAQITEVQLALEKPDKEVTVNYDLSDKEVSLTSNYFREVMYNLEHTIHHQAMIKVGVLQLTQIVLPEAFGVAPSTIKHRMECVQ